MTVKDAIRLFWCLYVPWHRWAKQEQVGHIEQVTCSCGRTYRLNHILKEPLS
jgi:hypothetical protein